MSTPIEIVRNHNDWQNSRGRYAIDPGSRFVIHEPPYGIVTLTAAIDAVLRDAERYKALEAAFERHCNDGAVTVMRWKGQRIWHYTKEPDIDGATLAELADRLREGAK